MSKRLGWAILLLAVSTQTGCPAAVFLAGGAGGAAGVAWTKGKLQEELKAPLSKVHKATISALKELELPIKEDRKDALTAEIRSQFADGKDVWIDIRSLAEASTRITIRVGLFGDESRSRRVLNAIRHYL